MTGFDPSMFVQAERKPSPSVAAPSAPVATASEAPQVAENRDRWAVDYQTVATVAGVAVCEDLPLDLPFAREINRMFRYPPAARHFRFKRWRWIMRGVSELVLSGKAGEALGLGWSDLELFGVYARPWAVTRLPHAAGGFCMSAAGRTIGNVSADWIEVTGRRGDTSRYYREHAMSMAYTSALMWIAFDPARWPLDELI